VKPSAEHEAEAEIRRLKRELAIAKEERAILKKSDPSVQQGSPPLNTSRSGTIAADDILHLAISALSSMSSEQLRQTYCPPKWGKITLPDELVERPWNNIITFGAS
jgi:hypothetical protein